MTGLSKHKRALHVLPQRLEGECPHETLRESADREEWSEHRDCKSDCDSDADECWMRYRSWQGGSN